MMSFIPQESPVDPETQSKLNMTIELVLSGRL
jgi:hypothetical protein